MDEVTVVVGGEPDDSITVVVEDVDDSVVVMSPETVDEVVVIGVAERGDPGPPAVVEEATETDPGIVQMTGDLAGTGAAPVLRDPPIDFILLFENALA